ncbi:MAG: hypothetical protein ACH37Z_15640 [Anaerolineae bacterium]
MGLPPFDWMWRDPAQVQERLEAEIQPLLDKGRELERRNNRRRIRKLLKEAKARQSKGQR